MFTEIACFYISFSFESVFRGWIHIAVVDQSSSCFCTSTFVDVYENDQGLAKAGEYSLADPCGSDPWSFFTGGAYVHEADLPSQRHTVR
jgi:hypothetical protein